MPEHRSAKVRRILQLQGRAATLQARYESTMARIASARYQAAELRQQALSGGQLAAAQRLLAMIAEATAGDGGANRGWRDRARGPVSPDRHIASLHDPAGIRKLLAHLGMARSGSSPGPAPAEPGAAAP